MDSTHDQSYTIWTLCICSKLWLVPHATLVKERARSTCLERVSIHLFFLYLYKSDFVGNLTLYLHVSIYKIRTYLIGLQSDEYNLCDPSYLKFTIGCRIVYSYDAELSLANTLIGQDFAL
uniref:Uncharacterized protein n=1 Tax=Oryza brachyantha TaxID=4533 RepID=J3L4K1_ORYBR